MSFRKTEEEAEFEAIGTVKRPPMDAGAHRQRGQKEMVTLGRVQTSKLGVQDNLT